MIFKLILQVSFLNKPELILRQKDGVTYTNNSI